MMPSPEFVQITPQPLERYRSLLGEALNEIELVAVEARREFAGRAIWHVSSTARGGGVSEMLHAMLPYVRGAGVDTRWVVLREGRDFFTVTKRVHNHLHGDPGDGGGLGDEERNIYELALAADATALRRLVQEGDIAYLHDPQTAGLVVPLKESGVKVIWRCHIGVDEPNQLVQRAHQFLRPYVEAADAYVFSRREYAWDGLDQRRLWLMPPAIDPFSPKNQELDVATVDGILGVLGLTSDAPDTSPAFVRADRTPGRLERTAEVLQDEPLPPNAKLVVQVSRWDRLKDPRGLLECFERYLDDDEIHLVLAAPTSRAVADDPEGAAVYGDVAESWRRMPAARRRRAHLVSLPMDDLDENGVMVNAIQRRADVVVQKSLAEGFGLTVAEGMWKRKPIVASGVGGIQDQIVDGESGLLVDDPHDLEGFGRAIRGLLIDPARSARLGEAARQRVMERFLAVRRLAEYVDLVASLLPQ
jgi:trehalose synthase